MDRKLGMATLLQVLSSMGNVSKTTMCKSGLKVAEQDIGNFAESMVKESQLCENKMADWRPGQSAEGHRVLLKEKPCKCFSKCYFKKI